METGGTIWEHNKLRLFISHTHPHKRDVGAQKLALDALGVHAFVAHDDIEPSLAWQAVIEEALATCDAMVAWLTPDFHDSKWTDQEIGACLTRAIQIVPVRCGLDPYGFIGKFQALPAVGKPPFDVTQEIVEALARNGNTAARFLGPAAQAFACSRSYEIARTTFKTLSLLPEEGWTEEHLTVLEQAPGRNNQIEECIYEQQRLPDVLRAFIALRRRRAGPTPTTVSSGASIECRGDVEKINDVLTPNNRVFQDNRTVWLYVKNQGQTSEFSARFWNVQGCRTTGAPTTASGMCHGRAAGQRLAPEIDGYGGERRVKVANVALSPDVVAIEVRVELGEQERDHVAHSLLSPGRCAAARRRSDSPACGRSGCSRLDAWLSPARSSTVRLLLDPPPPSCELKAGLQKSSERAA